MDFHIDRKIAYLLVGTLVIGMIIGAWLSNLSMHHHMSRMMMRGGDMGMMMKGSMHGDNIKGMYNQKSMMKHGGDMGQKMPLDQINPGQAMPEPQVVPVNN